MAALFPNLNQITYPQTLAAGQKVPVIGNRIFATLAEAQEYVDKIKGTAIPGIYLSVIADGENNGAYWVAQAAGYDGATKGLLQKLGEGSSSDITLNGQAIIEALGYTPFNAASFTKANIKSTLGISNWALKASAPSYTKSDVGLGNVDNIAASEYFEALSSGTTDAVSITVGGVTKSISASTLKTSLSLGLLAYQPSVASALGYTPFDAANFTKENIKSKLGISDWALASDVPSVTIAGNKIQLGGSITSTTLKTSLGLDKVDNKAAKDYFTLLTSNGSYPIYMTVGGTTKYITAATIKSSLGLKALAYVDSIDFSDLNEHPTTLDGYGITDALGAKDTAVAAEKLSDDSAFTIWGNTFFTGGKPKSINGNISLGNSNTLKIGGATLAWDSSANMLKIDKGVYSEGAITAKGVGSSSSASGPVWIDLDYIMSSDGFTDAQVASAGLTSDVINNLIAGKYTKVVYETQDGRRNVWDYSGNMTSEGDICLFFQQGDGFDVRSGISMIKSGAGYWQVLFGEI